MVSAPLDNLVENGLIDLSYWGQFRSYVTFRCCKTHIRNRNSFINSLVTYVLQQILDEDGALGNLTVCSMCQKERE